MITQSEGRSRTERTTAELQAMLDADLQLATPDEIQALQALLSDVLKGGTSQDSLYDFFMDLEYKERPVDIETFCTDPYYLGETCANIYPVWMQDLKDLFAGNFREFLLTGSIGAGKSFVASIVLLYVLYEISCMRDPHRSFGLSPGSDISAVVFSVTEDLAIKVIFENVATKAASSPYFQQKFYPDILKKEIRFPNNIRVAPKASNDTSALGMNVIMAIIDESNFLNRSKNRKKIDPTQGGADRAEVIYNTLKRRMISRYQSRGKLPGMFVIASSKQSVNDFTERMIKTAKEEKDTGLFVRDYALWDVKPGNYSAKRFYVLCGTDQMPSRILTDEEAAKLRSDPSLEGQAVIIAVPEDLRSAFVKDLEGAIKDLAGISITSSSPFIKQRQKIISAIDNTRRHPFTTEIYDMAAPGQFVWPEIVQGSGKRRQGASVPRWFPTALRHVHLDLSLKKDRTGLTCGCISGWTTVDRVGPDKQIYAEHQPVYHIDFMIEIKPPMGGEIDQGKVIGLIYDLAAHGIPIASVSADRWQSAFVLQSLAQRGYVTEVISVDATMEPYETLKMAFYEDRIRMYPYGPVYDDLKGLEVDWGRQKVDHPVGGKKDVADSLAGVVYGLAKNKYSAPVMPVRSDTRVEEDDSEWFSDPSLLGNPDFMRAAARGAKPIPGMMPSFLGAGVAGGLVSNATPVQGQASSYISPSQLMFGPGNGGRYGDEF